MDKLYKLIPKPPIAWNQQDITIWLEFIEQPELDEKFKSHAVDGSILLELTQADLKEMGVIDTQFKLKNLHYWLNQGLREYTQYLQQQSVNIPYTQQQIRQSVGAFTIADDSSMVYTQLIVKPPILDQSVKDKLYVHDLAENKQYVVEDVFTIGRSPENKLVYKEDYVSRFHCKVYRQKEYHYIQDVGSASGTFIQLDCPTILKAGVILQMGSFMYRIYNLVKKEDCITVYVDMLDGNRKGEKFDFQLKMDQTSLIFGRALKTFADDNLLSGQHAQFTYIQDGLVIEDLDSKNGVWLRLSEGGIQSEPIKVTRSRRVRIAYEKFFDLEYQQ
ncbi:hypothetical protein pb186bvf_000460 [Paramecium bursaria]